MFKVSFCLDHLPLWHHGDFFFNLIHFLSAKTPCKKIINLKKNLEVRHFVIVWDKKIVYVLPQGLCINDVTTDFTFSDLSAPLVTYYHNNVPPPPPIKVTSQISTLFSRLSKNVWVVFANRFDQLSRNFLSVVRSLLAKTYPNFVFS